MIPRRSAQKVTIQKVKDGQIMCSQDLVVVEEPLEIRLVFEETGHLIEQSISITMRTPGDDFEFTAGFLFNEGIIRSGDEIEQMSYCVGLQNEKQHYNVVSVRLRPGVRVDHERLLRHFYTTSSCGVCGKASLDALQMQGYPALPQDRPVVSHEVVHALPEKLRQVQSVFKKTGGLHAAALFDVQGNLRGLREDLGRHNAVDKLIGEQVLSRKVPLSDYVMVTSGRASFEILQKALMGGIPIVVAVSAPSSLAVNLASEFGITLLGFVRGESFNIYTGAQRIQF
jgi:FdhD protein